MYIYGSVVRIDLSDSNGRYYTGKLQTVVSTVQYHTVRTLYSTVYMYTTTGIAYCISICYDINTVVIEDPYVISTYSYRSIIDLGTFPDREIDRIEVTS